ncbi:MAG: PilZ domain-containing protein [Gammaproteobacteria bacterium]|nr:PilZ domain-containing protein [Gammaproteobacteria bacterium]
MFRSHQQDQRSDLRHSTRDDVVINYSLIEIDGSNTKHASRVTDYSSQGIRFIAHEPLPIGQIIHLTVSGRALKRDFNLTGQVKWCLEVDAIPTYHAGLSFIEDGSKDFIRWVDSCSNG